MDRVWNAADIRRYWLTVEPAREQLDARARERARIYARGAELVDRFGAAQLRLQRAAAIDGAWEPLFAGLRAIGAAHATAGRDLDELLAPIEATRDEAIAWLHENVRDPDELAGLHRGLAAMLGLETEHVLAGFREVAVRRRTHAEHRARALFEHGAQAMWTYDANTGRYTDVNAAALAMYGYTREQFLALTPYDLRVPEEHDAARADLVKTAALGEGRMTVRGRHHRGAGDRRLTVDIEIRGIDVDGDRFHLAIVTDASERETQRIRLERAEDQLRHAQKMDALGRLAGGVAHDFNNLLTVVLTCACFVEEALRRGPTPRQDAAEIRRAAERGTALTRQLLALGRHGKARPERVDIAELFAQLASMLRRLVGERVAARGARAARRRACSIDPGQLEQVLMNLAVNARDAMPAGGRLGIETSTVELDADAAARAWRRRRGATSSIAVTDTGVGMDAETQRRIFEPFFTTKETGKGTGLGLSIVHGIVAQAGRRDQRVQRGRPRHDVPRLPARRGRRHRRPRRPRVRDGARDAAAADACSSSTTRPTCARSRRARCARPAVGSSRRRPPTRRVACASSHDRPIDVALIDVALADGARRRAGEARRASCGRACGAVLMSGYPARALAHDGAPVLDLLREAVHAGGAAAAIAERGGAARRDRRDRAGAARGAPRAARRRRRHVPPHAHARADARRLRGRARRPTARRRSRRSRPAASTRS